MSARGLHPCLCLYPVMVFVVSLLPSPSSWPASMKMKSACEKGSTREKKKKKNVLYIKSKWICGWLLQHAIDWPHTEAQNKEIKGGVRGGRTNCQCALHVVACCVLWPAGPQRQESPFNLNTYHHDNNLVTLSEANLFISRFFFSLLLSLSPSPHSSSGSDSLTLLSCVSWITHSQLVVSSLSSVRPSVKCCSV